MNEDSYNIIAGYPGVPVSFIIADGMGGHNSGEVASKMAVDLAGNYIHELSGNLADDSNIASDDHVLSMLDDIMNKVNTDVYIKSKEDEANYGMGTTLIIVMIYNEKIFIGHIGDSRVYLIRDGCISRLTVDHSYIEELVRNGSLTREEAQNNPRRNLITRALGCTENIVADMYSYTIEEKDIFLMCTDGLTDMLSDNEILNIVEETDDLEIACNRLVDMANKNGGDDNITVIVFRY